MVSDDLSFMARYGARLADNGYAVIPIMPGTKKPGRFRRGRWVDYPAWTRHCCRATTEHEIEIWCGWPDAAVGIACGAVIGIDIDIAADAEAAIDLERFARTCLGDTPALRIGCAPKRLLVYRAGSAVRGPQAGAARGPGCRPAVRRLRSPPGHRAALRLAGGVARRSPAREPARRR